MFSATLLNLILVTIAVLIHYEMLLQLSNIIPRLSALHRLRIVIGIFGSLGAHIVEIWTFAFGYFFMVQTGKFGTLQGAFNGSILDCVYFSFISYTSVGFGDVYPEGLIRFTAGIEALTGLVLITWTASFMFIEMQKFWSNKNH